MTSPTLDLKITYLSPTALSVHGRALRRHDAQQIEALMASIRQFGFLNPLLIDADYAVLVGKARLEAARRLDMKAIPVIRIDHLTPAEQRAYAIAENRLAELSEWDRDALAIEFQELKALDLDFDLAVTGFDAPEIDAMVFGDIADANEDEVVVPDGPAVSRRGDLWLLGPHRLLCGDATDLDDHRTLMGDQRARTVFIDVPYNVPINGHVSVRGGRREFVAASGEMSTEEFRAFLAKSFAALARSSVDGALIYSAIDWRHAEDMTIAARNSALSMLNLCVWTKNPGMGSLYRSAHELIFVFKSGDAPHCNNIQLGRHGRNRSNVWPYPSANSTAEGRRDLERHPTPKPVAMVADALLDSSDEGDIVLDTFCGGGTILIAAERVKRRARAIELDPLYVDAAVLRWQAETGLEARCAKTGATFAEIRQARAMTTSSQEACHVG